MTTSTLTRRPKAGTAPAAIPPELDWGDYERLVEPQLARFDSAFALCYFTYIHPARLQRHLPRYQQKDMPVRIAYTAWGNPLKPLVITVGGIANTARRWDYLAKKLAEDFYVVCPDWAGRGLSGWMPTQGDYTIASYVEQILQLLKHLGRNRLHLVGSSLGGSVALALNATLPGLIDRLVLNDVGPFIPAKRRQRRAHAVARHYVFRTPTDLFRRFGAASKHDGPVSDEELLHTTYFQTKWSDEEDGRIYRHDPRALQAFAEDAQSSLVQWDEWATVTGPVLVVHGMLSDALLEPTLRRMHGKHNLVVMHVPKTGHTPTLSQANQIHFIGEWLHGHGPDDNFTCLNTPTPPRRLFQSPPREIYETDA